MDERVKKCLDKVCEAYIELLASASNEMEAVGLFAVLQNESEEVIVEAITEGFEKFENREKEGN
jgi:uncharacterized pyridoxal phosphate-containing UPF0001 family protein